MERHANNLSESAAAYEYQKNGERILEHGLHVSANGIFRSVDWDVITVQQVSGKSGLYDSFDPYLSTVLHYIRTLCPTAKIVWHQTWAYATDSTHPEFANYERDQTKMFSMIEEASHRIAKENGLGLIESGRAIQLLRKELEPDGTDFCRDGFHLSFDCGRYAAAYVWARYFGCKVDPFYLPRGAKQARIEQIRACLDACM